VGSNPTTHPKYPKRLSQREVPSCPASIAPVVVQPEKLKMQAFFGPRILAT
jgi:hypothetical protein